MFSVAVSDHAFHCERFYTQIIEKYYFTCRRLHSLYFWDIRMPSTWINFPASQQSTDVIRRHLTWDTQAVYKRGPIKSNQCDSCSQRNVSNLSPLKCVGHDLSTIISVIFGRFFKNFNKPVLENFLSSQHASWARKVTPSDIYDIAWEFSVKKSCNSCFDTSFDYFEGYIHLLHTQALDMRYCAIWLVRY